jgi:hypothetical protein
LYCSPSIFLVIKSRRMRLAVHVARMGERRGVYKVLVGKPDAKRPRRRPRPRWKTTIKINFQEVEWGSWTGLKWLRIGTGCRRL